MENATEQEYHFTFDGHGSTRVLLDALGAIAEIYAFDAYGNAVGFNTATAKTEFLYSGEQFDSKIGQQYLRARYYNPANGTFNRLDPFFGNLNDPQSLHKYTYCHANPVNNWDPVGEMSIGVAMASSFNIGMQVAGVFGVAQTVHKIVTEGVDALTFWDVISLLPFGYAGAGKAYAHGMQGITKLAHAFPGFVNVLKRYGDDVAQVAAKYHGIVSGNYGTGVHQFFKHSSIGKFVGKLDDLTKNSSWMRVTLDKQIAPSGKGSRPDITIQFPNFRFAIAIDVKPVPREVFDKGWLPSVIHLYESTEDSIRGRREGTIMIFDQKGYTTLYLVESEKGKKTLKNKNPNGVFRGLKLQ